MQYDVIVIGAGPGGLFAAGQIAKGGKKVLLLEKNKQAGKKLLISGSGQCNFTHDGEMKEFESRYGTGQKFLKKSFSLFTNKDSMAFFQSKGIKLEIRENKKVFPASKKSQTILHALLEDCSKYRVTIQYEAAVSSLEKEADTFLVQTSEGTTYTSEYVVIATGGKSYPLTGSTGDGYVLAESMGHKIITPKPALTYVTTHEKAFTKASGIAFPAASMVVWRDGKKQFERQGSILFTHKGLSGPLILDATRWIEAGDQIQLNMLHPETYESVKKKCTEEIPTRGKDHIGTYLVKELGLIRSIASIICELARIEEDKPCARISKEERELLTTLITKCPFNVSGLGGYHIAMVTAGGVTLKEVNPTTMESRKQKGLYFVGEVLDIDGDTGGYNIQAAFSMAYTCAMHINKD